MFCEYAAIETCKQQLFGTQSECSEQTSTDEGLVFEEFIPIKKRALSLDCDENDEEDDDEEQHSSHKMKSDWLRSVQLWNPTPSSAKEV